MTGRLFAIALLAAQIASAGEPVVTLSSTVTGNREQPRVMHIVPWQQPGDVEYEYQLGQHFTAELFAPVDRDEFVRGLRYQALIGGVAGEAAGAVRAPVD